MDQVGGVSSIFLYIQLTGIAKLLYLFKKKNIGTWMEGHLNFEHFENFVDIWLCVLKCFF